ncbi:hypothetical protein [Pedobacter cryotolerans]|uniref:Uncharacterized protein n=1 Tax=Pedobacter cryotolerans TaxID=2571270 RepID=A0A4U1CGG8_9SPHI|nr:hypothetical protein [Pedobacter cryotolerans]TKC03481.1 hypothetical protein FA045_02620 [Pedobacter cryotolerans]
MKTLKLIIPSGILNKQTIAFALGAIILLLLWQILPQLLHHIAPQTGLLDAGIWQLLLFTMISFLLLLSSCIWLFNGLINLWQLTPIHTMVLQVKNLQLWQQFVLYWASFALLFLGSLLSLTAIF